MIDGAYQLDENGIHEVGDMANLESTHERMKICVATHIKLPPGFPGAALAAKFGL